MPGDFHISYPDTLDHYCRSSAAFSKEYTTSLLRQGVTDVEASMFEARLSQALRMSEQYDVPLYCSSSGGIKPSTRFSKPMASVVLPGIIRDWTLV